MASGNRGGGVRKSLLGLAGFGLALGVLYLVETLRYPRGTAAQPGPGLYPLLLGFALVVACAGTALEEWLGRRSGREMSIWPPGVAGLRIGAILLASSGYVVLLPYLGHVLLGTLALLVVFRVMGMRRWLIGLVVAAFMAFGSYYVFGVLLGVPLPEVAWFG